MPTSPMPATGFTIMVPKSETIDLNITMDQAIQFCVSCGVVIPTPQQGAIQNPLPSVSNLENDIDRPSGDGEMGLPGSHEAEDPQSPRPT